MVLQSLLVHLRYLLWLARVGLLFPRVLLLTWRWDSTVRLQAEYLRGPSMYWAAQMCRVNWAFQWQTIGYVILPQALRLALPSWSNEPISLLKTTAIVFLIAVQDLMAEGKRAATTTFDFVGVYLAVALVYLVMVFALDALLKFLERKTAIPGMDKLAMVASLFAMKFAGKTER